MRNKTKIGRYDLKYLTQGGFNYIIKKDNKLSEYKVKCKCGHSVVVPPTDKKKICKWCGNYVFTNKKEEFLYRTKEILGGVKNG